MNITGRCNLFAKKVKVNDKTTGKEKTITRFETNLSHKEEDGTYSPAFSIRVEFTKDCCSFEQANSFKENVCYMIEIEEGWLDTRSYVNKEGQQKIGLVYRINKCKTIDQKKFTPKSKNSEEADELPF